MRDQFVATTGITDLYSVFARTGEAPGARRLSAVIVPAGAPGSEIVERLYREIRALRIYESASDVQKVIITSEALSN